MIRRAALLQVVFAAVALSPFASAQVPFQLQVQDQYKNVTPIASGATLTLSAIAPSQNIGITLTATYDGASTVTVGPAQLSGAPAFSITSPSTPQTLSPGSSISIGILFTASAAVTTTGPASAAQLLIPFTVSGQGGTSGTFGVNLAGTTPNFILAYDFASNQNVIGLSNGSTLTFPSTATGSTSSAIVMVENTGNGPGTISSVQISGAAFAPQGLALLPGTVNAGGSLQFTIVYTPQGAAADTGTLQVAFPDRTVTVNLSGSGNAPTFTYQLIQNGQPSTIVPGQSISLPAIAAGSSSPFSVTVKNSGNGNGTINAAAVTGSSFQIVNPPAFPQTLAPGGLLTLNLNFIPPQSGAATSLLTVGGTSFTLMGSVAASQLGFSYTLGSVTVPVTASVVNFSPVQVGQSSTASLSIQNTGTAPATIINIATVDPKSAFTLANLPALPLNLAAGSSVSFNVTFAPTTPGTTSENLNINNQALTLTGSGNPPPALPAYQLTGVSSVEPALQQPSVGLTLSAPYPVALTGSLSMIEISNALSADPSVQFSTGGQTVAFSIPANTTQAIFQNGATSIRLQTGSVAGSVTLTPSFTITGGYSVTPASPTTLQFSVPAAVPQLLAVQVSQSTPTSFTLQVVGLDTSRGVTELDFVFTPAPKYNLAVSTVPVSVATPVSLWFDSAAAQPFGSQFVISVPFGVSSTSTITTNSLITIGSISVTAKNPLGTSNSVSTQVQ